MKASKATVNFEQVQAIAVFREVATWQGRSFSDDEIAARIGITPYNMIRRVQRYVKRLQGWAERVAITEPVYWRDWTGQLCAAEKRVYVWRLCAQHLGKTRAQLMREIKAASA